MAEMQQGNNDGAQRRRAERRVWTPQEESVLLASLKDLVANGWKSDNGFRGGYLTKLEEALSNAFRGTDLKAQPHIASKLQAWKRNYYSLSLMLARSGVGYNANGTHTIDCNQEQWEQIVKCDANAKTMRYKAWPMYEDWKEVFGKDMATGDAAEDIMDAVNELNRLDTQENGEYHHNLEDINMSEDVGETSINDTDKKASSSSKKDSKGKKRVADDTMVLLGELLGEINRCTNERLDRIASRIGYEFDVDKAKTDAFLQLEMIPGLSLDDKFDVCEIFADKTERLLVFNGLPEEARAQYVQRLLNSKRK